MDKVDAEDSCVEGVRDATQAKLPGLASCPGLSFE
jgi:hypothetical protein